MIAELFRNSDLSPLYTPILERGAEVLAAGIKTSLDLDGDWKDLAAHLRGLSQDIAGEATLSARVSRFAEWPPIPEFASSRVYPYALAVRFRLWLFIRGRFLRWRTFVQSVSLKVNRTWR